LSKLHAVLHEVTFLDFSFIWGQAKRYRRVLLLLPILFLGFSYLFESTQFTVYTQELNVRILDKNESLPKSMLVTPPTPVSFEELSASLTNFEFRHIFSESIVTDESFSSLDFTSVMATSKVNHQKLFGHCLKKNECIMDVVTGLVENFYSIESGRSENRFVINVSSTSDTTTRNLSRIFIKSVEFYRRSTAQKIFQQQIVQIDELIKTTRDQLYAMGGVSILQKYEDNKLKLKALRYQMNNLETQIAGDQSLSLSMESRVKETGQRTKGRYADESEKLSVEKLKKQLLKMNDLRLNLGALNALSERELTSSERLVMEEIKQELKVLEKDTKLASLDTKRIAEEDFFNQSAISQKSSISYEKKVIENKIQREKESVKNLQVEIDNFVKENYKIENESTILKQDLETIKILETKLITTKLMMTTTTSDLLFEKYSHELSEFNRSSKTKNFLFAFLTSFSLIFILVIFRYFLDDRIYEEHELRTCFKDLNIIGKTPEFK
jgi:hypothetical protein